MVQRVYATARDQPIGNLLVAPIHDGKAWLAAEVAVVRAQHGPWSSGSTQVQR